MSRLLTLLAKAFDTKGYPDDKDPNHWFKINGTPIHHDGYGNIDGGAGGKFNGKQWNSSKHPHKVIVTLAKVKEAWINVTKEVGELRRVKTEKAHRKHNLKLKENFELYLQLHDKLQKSNPSEAARFRPRSIDYIKGLVSGSSLNELAEAISKPYTGKSAYGGCSPTATAEEIFEWRKTCPTLKNYKEYAWRQESKIEQVLINSKAGITKTDIEHFKNQLKSLIENSDFAMQVPSSVLLDKILKGDGRFKSQFETASSRGAYSLRGRARMASQLFGHSFGIDAIQPKDREKYGFMISKDLSDDKHPAATWYGDCLIRFNKEKLKGKVTYTMWDSLDHHRDAPNSCAGDIDNPSMAGFAGVRPREVKAIMRRAERAKTIGEAIGYNDDGSDKYFELQYHEDELTLDCVDSVTFTSVVNKEAVALLKAKGIKCYKIGILDGKAVEIT